MRCRFCDTFVSFRRVPFEPTPPRVKKHFYRNTEDSSKKIRSQYGNNVVTKCHIWWLLFTSFKQIKFRYVDLKFQTSSPNMVNRPKLHMETLPVTKLVLGPVFWWSAYYSIAGSLAGIKNLKNPVGIRRRPAAPLWLHTSRSRWEQSPGWSAF